MSDQILSDLLDRSVENVSASQPAISDLLRRGHVMKRRRRAAGVVGAVVASLVVVGGVVVSGQRLAGHDVPPADRPPSAPQPPAGMRWVGVGRTVVAVPQVWPVLPGIYCAGPAEPYATVTQWHMTVGCPPIGDDHGGNVNPAVVDVEGSAAGDFTARLEGSSGASGVTQSSLDQSTTRLPDGWLAVPSGEPYGGAGPPTVSSEIAALKAAGFQVVRKDAAPTGRWQPVTTSPGIGSPARVGSAVVVYDHGTIASSATLTGTLAWVGGPAPGSPVPHPGMIHVVNDDDSVDQTVQADDSGAWEIYLPPGTYSVRATSPGYGSTRGSFDGCSATRDGVTVRADETLSVSVYCQLR